jgi:hypothetical protein
MNNMFFSPPILFFCVGLASTFLGVNLTVPSQIARFLSFYLLLSIGFQGGAELSHTSITLTTIIPLFAAFIASIIIPIYNFFLLRTKFNVVNSAALAATYGSVSAVTFITSVSYLQELKISFGGYMIASLALMEAPAIIISLYLARNFEKKAHLNENKYHWYEGFTETSVFLLLASLLVGFISGESGSISLKPFTQDIFKGFLSIFMIDMGVLAGQRISEIKDQAQSIILFALALPLINSVLGILTTMIFKLNPGDGFLLTVLCASASYIAVPAALRLALPDANPSYYLSMALGITFPFNIIFGLPLYLKAISYITG